MIETKNGKKIYSDFENGYLKALDDVLNLDRHTYKTTESGFIKTREAIFVGDVERIKETNYGIRRCKRCSICAKR